MEEGKRTVRTVRARNISDLAGEWEVREFFSFSGEIEHADIRFDGVATGRTAYVTFKDPKALEIAILLSAQVFNQTPYPQACLGKQKLYTFQATFRYQFFSDMEARSQSKQARND